MDVDVEYLKSLVNKKSPTILDVGCYDGRDTLKLNSLFEDATIYCFDADSRSIELFKKLVGDFPNIELCEIALSDVDGEILFYHSESEEKRHYSDQKSWSASSSIKEPDRHLDIFDNISFKDGNYVKSSRLDTWMENRKINTIDLMWVDVNGGENEFLNGAKKSIIEKTNYLYIEFSAIEGQRLYKDCWTKDQILNFLPTFKELGVYNFFGNFGNVLLENTKDF